MTSSLDDALRRFIGLPLLVLLTFSFERCAYAQLNETWTLTVAGQTVRPNPDGTFRISNISSIDAVGPGGAPDFLSDDLFRVEGIGEINGVVHYTYSEPFRIRSGSTYRIQDLTFSMDPPPELIASIHADGPSSLNPGETGQWTITAINPAGDPRPITLATSGTVYTSSRPEFLAVEPNGEISALIPGVAFVSIRNQGVTTVKRIVIVSPPTQTSLEGFVQFLDGSAVVGVDILLTGEVLTTTDSQGFFQASLEGNQTQISVSAAFSDQDQDYRGRSDLISIVPDGITDAGIIVVSPFTVGNLFPRPTYFLNHEFARSDLGGIAVGDFDGDGRVDVASNHLIELTVRLADESGRLDRIHRYPDGGSSMPGALAAGDLDGDLDLDLFEGLHTSSRTWENDGSGNFSIRPHGVPRRSTVAHIIDLNGDGLGDVVFGNGSPLGNPIGNNFLVALNNGGILEAEPTQYFLTSQANEIEFADVDNDLDMDGLILVNNAQGEALIQLALNDGTGHFVLADLIPLAEIMGLPRIAVLDLSLDSLPDIATTSPNREMLLFANNGTATGFDLLSRYPDVSSVNLAADMDLDGDDDVLAENYTLSIVRQNVLFKNELGQLTRTQTTSTGEHPREEATGDVDGDGRLDLIQVDSFRTSYSILMSDSANGFRGEDFLFLANPAQQQEKGDVNGDGLDDILISSGPSAAQTNILIFLGQPSGELIDGGVIPVDSSIRKFGVWDISGDGSQDVVCLIGNLVQVFSNNGSGDFSLSSEHTLPSIPNDLDFVDIDDNDLVDIVTGGNSIMPLLQTSLGVFSLGTETPTTSFVRHLISCDVTRDGQMDLVTVQDQLRVLTALGGGLFSEGVGITTLSGFAPLAKGDFNNDGDCDIIAGDGSNRALKVLLNLNGTLTHVHSCILGINQEITYLDVGDFDEDGTLDAAGSLFSRYSSTAVFRNPNGTGELTVEYYGGIVELTLGTGSVLASDVDQDGHLDILTLPAGRPLVTILPNQLPD